ncbi:MAG: hypothetical protein L0Y66_03525 [Myxococcaceae bacterium]|nr:hypothetical protein [Myxococcaceae bacterium]MCI0673881.1 hypothetical protein [Myxococcaceae bacterium]
MSVTTAVLQLHHRESFERTVTRALGAGALAGAACHLLAGAGLQLPLAALVLSAVVLAAARGDRLDRVILMGLGAVLPPLPFALGLTPGWAVASGTALSGALLVRAQLCERGGDSRLGEHRPTVANHVLGAVLGAGLGAVGLVVARILSARLLDASAPAALAVVSAGVVLALFASLSALAAHLALSPDPVETRCAELIPQLTGELHALASRAHTTYRQCGQLLSALPREPARDELARALAHLTQDAVELASEWAGVEAQLQERAGDALARERADLERSAAAARDALARRQLELAASSLREEEERLAELAVQRERTVARLHAHVALLDRTRVAVVGLRSGQAQRKAAELSALARRVRALSAVQLDEGRLQDAVATGAELAQVEATSADVATSAERVRL